MANESVIEGGSPPRKAERGRQNMTAETAPGRPARPGGEGIWERIKNLRNWRSKEQARAAAVSEQAIGAQNLPLPENLANKRVSRRAFLHGAAVVGAVAVEEATLGLGRKALFSQSSQERVAAVPTDFDRMREVLGTAGFVEAELVELTRITNDLERAGSRLANIVSIYEADKLPDGTPKLLVSRRAQFGHLDVTPLLDSSTKTEKEFWEGQIPFLKDSKRLDYIKAQVFSLQNSPASRNNVATLLRISDPIKDSSTDFGPYLEKANLPKNGVKVVEVPQSPLARTSKVAYDMPQARTAVEQIAGQMPHIGEVEADLLPITTDYFGEIGGVFSEDGKPSPDTLKYFPDLKRPGGEAGKTLIVLAIYSLNLPHAAAHEFSHNNSPFENAANYLRYLGELTPALMLKYEAVSSDPEWTMTVIDPTVIFSKKMRRATGGYRPQDMSPKETIYPEDFKLQKARMHREWLSKGRLIFGKDVLGTELVERFARETPTTPFYYGSFAFGEEDRTMANFVNMEKNRLDQLAAQSPLWRFAVAKIRENASTMTEFAWAGLDADLPFPKKPETLWQSVPTLANAFLVQAYMNNVREVVDEITPEKRKDIVQKIVSRQQSILSEMAAEHQAFSVTLKPYILQPDRDPGAAYLNLLDAELRKSSR